MLSLFKVPASSKLLANLEMLAYNNTVVVCWAPASGTHDVQSVFMIKIWEAIDGLKSPAEYWVLGVFKVPDDSETLATREMLSNCKMFAGSGLVSVNGAPASHVPSMFTLSILPL